MTEKKSFREVVKETVLASALEVNTRHFDFCDSEDFIEDIASLRKAKNAIGWLANYCDDREVKDALETVAYFLEVADNDKDNIVKALADYDNNRQAQINRYALEVAEKYYNTLTDNAKTMLEVCENVKSAEDLADLVIPDLTDFEDVDFQLYEDVIVDELLSIELQNVENVAEVLYK